MRSVQLIELVVFALCVVYCALFIVLVFIVLVGFCIVFIEQFILFLLFFVVVVLLAGHRSVDVHALIGPYRCLSPPSASRLSLRLRCLLRLPDLDARTRSPACTSATPFPIG